MNKTRIIIVLKRVYTITWFKQLKLKSSERPNQRKLARHDQISKQRKEENKPIEFRHCWRWSSIFLNQCCCYIGISMCHYYSSTPKPWYSKTLLFRNVIPYQKRDSSSMLCSYLFITVRCLLCLQLRGGKNIHADGYPRVKSVTGTGRVAKRVSTGIINEYLTTHYYMDTDMNLIVPILTGTHTQS